MDEILSFYGHKNGSQFCVFSNFYYSPFTFMFPACVFRDGWPSEVQVDNSEKGIMLCKAMVMGDRINFDNILLAHTPAQCKAFGRKVTPFVQRQWDLVVEDVAHTVLLAKFKSQPLLRDVLLSTGQALLVEAAPRDLIWGVGIAMGDPRLQYPDEWRGGNLLGKSLMRVRQAVNNEVYGGPHETE